MAQERIIGLKGPGDAKVEGAPGVVKEFCITCDTYWKRMNELPETACCDARRCKKHGIDRDSKLYNIPKKPMAVQTNTCKTCQRFWQYVDNKFQDLTLIHMDQIKHASTVGVPRCKIHGKHRPPVTPTNFWKQCRYDGWHYPPTPPQTPPSPPPPVTPPRTKRRRLFN